MKKIYYLISVLVALGIGILIGKYLYDQPVKELSLTVYADGYANGIQEIKKITDKTQKGEAIMDDLMVLLIQSDFEEDIKVPEEEPNYSFRLWSVESGYTLRTGEIWFLDDETSLITNPIQEDQQITSGFNLGARETRILKQLIESF